jgi:hypothetical protein
MKAALHFQTRLDQDGDGVPELWGAGSSTYDWDMYPYFGLSPYVITLYLAAIKVVHLVASESGDFEFAEWARSLFSKVQQVMENELWSESLGYYICWSDKNHRVWKGHRSHEEKSDSCQISQLAGAWWAELLNLGDIVDPTRRKQALLSIAELNVARSRGMPADEVSPDGSYKMSMFPYAQVYFVAQAIAAGLPDIAWEAFNKIYQTRYELDGCPWDAFLQWGGEGNTQPQWGRWYISTPSSWYLLWAIGGARVDRLRGKLSIKPNWPTEWGDHLSSLPVYMPGFQGVIDCRRGKTDGHLNFIVKKIFGEPLRLSSISCQVDAEVEGETVKTTLNGEEIKNISVPSNRLISINQDVTFKKEGDGFTFTIGV